MVYFSPQPFGLLQWILQAKCRTNSIKRGGTLQASANSLILWRPSKKWGAMQGTHVPLGCKNLQPHIKAANENTATGIKTRWLNVISHCYKNMQTATYTCKFMRNATAVVNKTLHSELNTADILAANLLFMPSPVCKCVAFCTLHCTS